MVKPRYSEMSEKINNYEQRVNVKFCVKLGKGPSETYQMMKQAYGAACMSKHSVIEWHRKFRKGREIVTDIARSGRPTRRNEENIQKVQEFVNLDSSMSNEQIAKQLNVSRETVRRIRVENLKMDKRKKCKDGDDEKLVPAPLTGMERTLQSILMS